MSVTRTSSEETDSAISAIYGDEGLDHCWQRAGNSKRRNKLVIRTHLIRLKACSLQQHRKQQATRRHSHDSCYFSVSLLLGGELANTNSHSLVPWLPVTENGRVRLSVCTWSITLRTLQRWLSSKREYSWRFIYILKDLVINTRLPCILRRCWQNPTHCASVIKLVLIRFVI